jgi:hypothetical protein
MSFSYSLCGCSNLIYTYVVHFRSRFFVSTFVYILISAVLPARIINFTTNSKLAQKPPKLAPARRISRTFRPPQDDLHILPSPAETVSSTIGSDRVIVFIFAALDRLNPLITKSTIRYATHAATKLPILIAIKFTGR